MFAAVTSMRAITCARLQREFRAYATWDDGAARCTGALAGYERAVGPSAYAPAGLRVVVTTASSSASSKQ